eukprot:TRINITY_DN1011_c2_g1_i2.p1 TRINITY_DN1011_c2_g1~~TRINITY_DN1011_c2_g1_i2.p1  ORF type:complete len:275 (+),score=50.91 TRINITY_DN1011_c2_g1_i2:60-884(+)
MKLKQVKKTKDRYNGIHVSLKESDVRGWDVDDFCKELEEQVEDWRSEGIRGIWLRIPKEGSVLIPAATELGFEFHHAVPEYLMLTMWLPEGESRLPEAVHHQVGVGGLVLNRKRTHILVVREKTGITAGVRSFWKLPGGLVNKSEDIKDAVCREVLEETGIHTTFKQLAAFRETHTALHGNTDLYMVCTLVLDDNKYKPNEDNPKPTPCEREIEESTWLPVDEWISLPFYSKGLYGDMMKTSLMAALKDEAIGLSQVTLPSLRRRNESLYKAKL